MIVRLDKYLAWLWLVSRRDAARAVKNGIISVDGKEVTKSDMKIESGQIITFMNKEIEVKEFIYLLLYKPAWYVCSELDEWGHHSYKMLLQDCPYAPMLHVAWRLDRDTEWLVFCTNDGQFTHEIISPKKKLEKEYFVEMQFPISDEDIAKFEEGIYINDAEGEFTCMPAQVKRIDAVTISLVIYEGKYHQVKRMAQAIWNEVIYLRRDRIGDRTLGDKINTWHPEGLEKWEWKYISV
jgi:16S rRNA pseudouridine516 synthase